MRVYHFLNKKHGLENIKKRRLKIATIMELNDPFECFAYDVSDSKLRNAISDNKNTFAKNTGLLCFSKSWSNPVQWAHYAEKHRGICLGFDVPENLLVPIQYSRKRLVDEGVKILAGGEINQNLISELLKIKFHHWQYENEVRRFVQLAGKEKMGIYYEKFSKDLILKEVIIGSLSDITRKDIKEQLGEFANKVEAFKSRPAFKSFRVVRNKDKSLWV